MICEKFRIFLGEREILFWRRCYLLKQLTILVHFWRVSNCFPCDFSLKMARERCLGSETRAYVSKVRNRTNAEAIVIFNGLSFAIFVAVHRENPWPWLWRQVSGGHRLIMSVTSGRLIRARLAYLNNRLVARCFFAARRNCPSIHPQILSIFLMCDLTTILSPHLSVKYWVIRTS